MIVEATLTSILTNLLHTILATNVINKLTINPRVVPGSGSGPGPRSGPPLLGGLLRCLGSGPGSILGTRPLPGAGLLLLYRL